MGKSSSYQIFVMFKNNLDVFAEVHSRQLAHLEE
jgi:hypothetical protein